MKFTINKNGNEDEGYELLDPATYTFTILEVNETDDEGEPFIARTGIQYIKVKCCEKESGLRLTHCIFLDPERSLKVYHFLTAIDLEPEVGQEIDIDTQKWIHRMFRGKVEIRNGRNQIVAVFGFSQTAPEPTEKEIEFESDDEDEDDVPF